MSGCSQCVRLILYKHSYHRTVGAWLSKELPASAGCAPITSEEPNVLTKDTSWGVLSTVPVQERLRLTGLRVPNHPDAVRWLEAHYARQLYLEHSAQRGKDDDDDAAASCPSALAPSYAWSQRGRAARCGALTGSRAQRGRRTNLIIVPVGDRWDPVKANKCASLPVCAASLPVCAASLAARPPACLPACLRLSWRLQCPEGATFGTLAGSHGLSASPQTSQ